MNKLKLVLLGNRRYITMFNLLIILQFNTTFYNLHNIFNAIFDLKKLYILDTTIIL